MISLCTAVFAWGRQLRAAIGPNLTHLRRHEGYGRWVAVLAADDHGGRRPREDEALEQWIRERYQDMVTRRILVLVRALPHVEEGAYHASLSKNTSHAAVVTFQRHAHYLR